MTDVLLIAGLGKGLLNEILNREPDSIRDGRAVETCQVCGELARVANFHERAGAHCQGGELVAYPGAHNTRAEVPPD